MYYDIVINSGLKRWMVRTVAACDDDDDVDDAFACHKANLIFHSPPFFVF